MLNNVMPQRGAFFSLLIAHTDRLVAAANATLRLITGLGNPHVDIAALIDEVNLNETSADDLKDQLIHLLYESFTTPINRDQIHTLTIELDNVVNALKDVANAVGMYSIKESTPEAREMAALGADACMRLNRAVMALPHKNRKEETVNLCKEIDAIESQADRVQRKAISQLFEGNCTIWWAMKMREFYSLQEDVLDRCEDAAKTIEEILIENT